MKKYYLLFALLVFFTAASAQLNVSTSRLNGRYELKVSTGKNLENLRVRGDVTLTDDDANVKSISQNGFVEYKNKGNTLLVTPKNDQLRYTINGKEKAELNRADQVLVTQCVTLMMISSVDGANRMERIYSQKGASGVLDETGRFNSDYVKNIYLTGLVKKSDLSENEMVSLLQKANQLLESDYYKSELLQGVMTSYLANPVTFNAYLGVVSGIKSDYYQYVTLNKILKCEPNEHQLNEVFNMIATMKSDYYQSEIVKSLIAKGEVTDERFSALMQLASQMKSDYYQSEIILALLRKENSARRYSQTIAAMENMKSPYYRSQILARLIDASVEDEGEWSRLIAFAGDLGSDYYRAEALQKIAGRMPQSENLTLALEKAAKKIESDYYYGKVVREIKK